MENEETNKKKVNTPSTEKQSTPADPGKEKRGDEGKKANVQSGLEHGWDVIDTGDFEDTEKP